MSTNNPFTPNYQGTAVITVTASSAATALTKQGQSQQVVVSSLAANAVAFVEFGASTIAVAATSGFPILPGRVYTFTVGPTVTHIAVIGTNANTLYISCGLGVAAS